MKEKKRCAHCAGPFGLFSHHWYRFRFCSRKCKDAYLVKRARELESERRWLSYLGSGTR